MASHRPAFILIAPLLLAAALALCACGHGNLQANQPPAAEPAAAAQPAPAPLPTMAARPAPAAQPSPEAEPAPEEPMTRERASAACWMRYDRSRASLDARMKLVDKCIDERMGTGR